MSAGWKFEVIQKTLQGEDNRLSVSMLCEVAGVSRSGYYRWVKAEGTREEREKKDRGEFELILKAYNQRGYSKGARGIYMCMVHWNPPVVMNLKKIRRLMDKYGLVCPVRKANPYKRMAKALKTNHVADNLVGRKFTEYGPRKVLLTDITYIPYSGKFAYLSTVLDAYTKQILSYVLSDCLEVDFVLETVKKLVEDHGIELTKETLRHSDQGCHYTSTSFIRLVNDKELRQSMSRKGNCWDNAPQESFFGHMKDEIDVSECTRYREVKTIIDDWMSYYNNERYQWQLAKLSPNEYYKYITTGDYPLRGIIKERGRKEGCSSCDEAGAEEESKDDKAHRETGEEI
ncbi:MAG TPA: IS3 family transposase [Lachnospiraceae bacterium]|nr:IS3 family transposase [Lachnospiraceae bacterium]